MSQLKIPFNSKITLFILLVCINSITLRAFAAPIAPFKATFDVKILGFHIGDAYHDLTCEKQLCTLSSVAEPPGWAKRFINESAIEKTLIDQSGDTFKWLKYQKFLTRRYDDRTEKKTYTLIRDENNQRIFYQEKEHSWPIQQHVYDVISMAYAIQFFIKNKQKLPTLYLQGDKNQQKISFTEQYEAEELDLPIEDEIQTERFAFHNDKIAAELWLVPSMGFFPGRIEIDNKEQDRTIVLELSRLKQ